MNCIFKSEVNIYLNFTRLSISCYIDTKFKSDFYIIKSIKFETFSYEFYFICVK